MTFETDAAELRETKDQLANTLKSLRAFADTYSFQADFIYEQSKHRDLMRTKWVEIGQHLKVTPPIPFPEETTARIWERYADAIVAAIRGIRDNP